MGCTVRKGVAAVFASGIVLLQSLGCKEAVSPSEPAPITLNVSVKLAGVYPFDGFEIRVDGRPMTLLKTKPGLVVSDLEPGAHTVSLVLPAPECKTDGSNPVTIETASGDSARVQFGVTCVQTTGTIAVEVTVSGSDRPLWFRADVDSYFPIGLVQGNQTTVLYGSVAGGSHVVRVSDVPTYCSPTGQLSASVDVKTGATVRDTALARFDIHCDPPVLGTDPEAEIAFERDGFVMLVRESGGSPVALTDGTMPAWSPDGKKIAFQRSICNGFFCRNRIWLMTSAGGSQTPLKDEGYDDHEAVIGPNAGRIAFIRSFTDEDVYTYLVATNLAGDSLRIFSFENAVSTPSWSPNADQIVFVCRVDSSHTDLNLCVINTDKGCPTYNPSGCDLRFMTLTTDRGDHLDPAWSHDGRRIAFTLRCSSSTCPSGVIPGEPSIAVIDVSTQQVTRLAAGHDPAWSPDDSQLVFAGNPSSPGLEVYSLSDGSVRHLTNNPIDGSPTWRE